MLDEYVLLFKTQLCPKMTFALTKRSLQPQQTTIIVGTILLATMTTVIVVITIPIVVITVNIVTRIILVC